MGFVGGEIMCRKRLLLLLVVICLFLQGGKWLQGTSANEFADMANTFEKFVDELPIPPVIRARHYGQRDLVMTLTQFKFKLHRDLPETLEWGYNGISPGPTIEVEEGQKIRVHWKNELPTTHILKSPRGSDMGGNTPLPDVRNVTHLHGAVVYESDPMSKKIDSDGWPDNFTIPGEEQLAEYPNRQSARTLWYHDHAVATTGRNVATGLEGLYVIHDEYERSLNLPSGKFEIPLLIMARSIGGGGTLIYSNIISSEMYGNAIAVNGKLWPFVNVEPRKYRFRIVNGSNARAYDMKIIDAANRSAGPPIYQIGSDAGFLEHTAALGDASDPLSPRLSLAPAERADVIIDFSKFSGRDFMLDNSNRDARDGEIALPQLLLFKVGTALSEPDTSALPMHMRPIRRIKETSAAMTRQIVINQETLPSGDLVLNLNGKRWDDPITEKPVLGTTEIWEVVNTQPDVHPLHIHLVEFQVLDRRPFDVKAYADTGKIVYTGPAVPPDPNEMGWKDTVRANNGAVTRIIIHFGPNPGYYVYHCHILEHEDMDMMRPFQIVEPSEQW